jgi:hypothetical protein
LLAALAGSTAAAETEAASAALVAEAASTALKGAWGKPGPASAAEAPGAGVVDSWLQALRLATAANKATRRSDFFIAIPFEDNDEKCSRRVLESWNRTAPEPITKLSAFYLTGCTLLPAQVEIVGRRMKTKTARRRLLSGRSLKSVAGGAGRFDRSSGGGSRFGNGGASGGRGIGGGGSHVGGSGGSRCRNSRSGGVSSGGHGSRSRRRRGLIVLAASAQASNSGQQSGEKKRLFHCKFLLEITVREVLGESWEVETGQARADGKTIGALSYRLSLLPALPAIVAAVARRNIPRPQFCSPFKS